MKIIFAGTPEFSVPALQALLQSSHEVIAVYTQPDRPAGRGQTLRASPIKLLAQQYHVPIYQPQHLRHSDGQQTFIQLNADIAIVVAYGLLLPKVILAAPRYGCINAHASLLPRWRGAAPIQRAILAGDKETGVTIMQMAQGLDTGDMLYKTACAIETQDTAQELHDKLSQLSATALLHTLSLIENTAINPIPQNDELACYAAKLSKTEAQIDWRQSAIEIDRAIRAYYPFPIAYTYLHQQPIRIWHATFSTNNTSAIPGTIINANSDGIAVATGDGVLQITHLQLAGKKAMPTKEILNSRSEMFAIGNRFQYEL